MAMQVRKGRRGKNFQLVAKEGEPGCPKSVKRSPRGTGMTVLTYPCPTASRVSVAVRGCARVTGKAGENGQHSGELGAAHPGQDRRLPGVATHSRLLQATSA